MKRMRAIAVMVALVGVACGPEVNIVEPQEGDVLADSDVTVLIRFTSAARTFEVALDGDDVSGAFFITEEEAGGTVSGVSSGEHLLQVSYTSTAGFADTDSVVFSVQQQASQATLASITVSPETLTLTAGETANLTVTGILSDGGTVDLTTDADTLYASEDGTIVSVGTGGIVAGVGAGSALIGVQNGSFVGQVTVTVTEAAPES